MGDLTSPMGPLLLAPSMSASCGRAVQTAIASSTHTSKASHMVIILISSSVTAGAIRDK